MTRTGLFRMPVVAGAAVGLIAGLSGPPGTVVAGTTSHATTTARAVSPRAHGVTSRLTAPHVIATPFVIGVDAPTPTGHNIEYRDYFPRSGLTVNSGDVIDFMWDPELSPDSFHSATLLDPGTTVAADNSANGIVVPDTDSGAGETPIFTPFSAIAPTDPTCGTSGNPCTFNGGSVLSSGATGPGSDFFVKVTAPAGLYTFHCRVHAGMVGSFQVTAGPESSVAETEAAAAQQLAADTASIMAAEAAVNHAAYSTNPDGSHHVTITAGVGTAHVDALEMLPADVRVAPGDMVTWVTRSSTDEVHTITFPEGNASASVDPFLAPVCEGGPPDPALDTSTPPPTWCGGNPSLAEFPIDPAPHGGTTLATPATVATSGLIGPTGGALPSDTYSFTFSGAGNFTYQCKVHDFMHGAIHSQPSPGYWNVASDGGVFTHGSVPFDGSMGSKPLNKPIVGAADTPDPGYWMAASDGGVFSFGDAQFFGSMGGKPLNKPVVGMSGTPSGNGYRLVASDGGIFDFGDAGFFGSTGGMHLNKPIVGMATTPSGMGYWLVASDGGVFAFGDAAFMGSQGGKPLVSPVVGMASTPSGNGYWLVAADGGVFSFGDAQFFGSMGGKPLNKPVVGMASDLGGDGYWLLASDGGVFTFGKAPFLGSEGGAALNKPMVAIASV